MLRLIRRARRRLLVNELLSQAVNASAAALLCFILLLLVGTDLLQWQWLILAPALAAGIGIFIALKRLASPYAAAQMVDRRMGLADTLSTAWFFRDVESAPEGMLRGQQQQANRICETLDVRQAVPFHLPRRAYAVAALALLASSLFALRYGMTRSLDLHPPFARLVAQQFGLKQKEAMAKNSRRQPVRGRPADEPGQDSAAKQEQEKRQTEASDDPQPQDPGETGNHDSSKRGDKQMQAQNAEPESDAGDQDDAGDQAENSADSRSPGNQGDQQQGKRQPEQARSPNAPRDSSASNENSSLLSKMKDAFDNLLSRVKPPPTNSGAQPSPDANGRQQGQNRPNQQPSANNGERSNNGGQSDSKSPHGQGDTSPDPRSQAAKGDGPSGAKQPGSGIGTKDGDKSIRQAEQLAAMGKISEIIGKRSANLTGEATAEVQATSQQLRTPYAQRGAQHAQAGGEINRDEVPVALEGYVEKYFEQVRKQPAK